MSVRMRHTRSHTGLRRAHHALQSLSFIPCSKCKKLKPPHTVCLNCGTYRGRVMFDVLKKLDKKQRKEKERQLEGKVEGKEK